MFYINILIQYPLCSHSHPLYNLWIWKLRFNYNWTSLLSIVKCFISSTFPFHFIIILFIRLLSSLYTERIQIYTIMAWLHDCKTHWNEHLTILIMPFYWLYIDDNGFWMNFCWQYLSFSYLNENVYSSLAKHNEKWKFYWCSGNRLSILWRYKNLYLNLSQVEFKSLDFAILIFRKLNTKNCTNNNRRLSFFTKMALIMEPKMLYCSN